MALDQAEQLAYAAAQKEINATAVFLENYNSLREANVAIGTVNAFDSCFSTAQQAGTVDAAIPQSLIDIFDSVGEDGKPYILGAIDAGIKGYKAANGGEMPRADIVAAALSDGKLILKTKNEYDSTVNGTQLNAAGMESNSVIPSAAVVAIATRIANSIPLVAYLPNPTGSNQVPIVYGRNIATHNHGGVQRGDFLDGKSAPLQYFDSQFEFSAEKDTTDPKAYSVTTNVSYLPGTNKPNPATSKLPFMGGRVRIYVNGVEVGNDATVNHSKFVGNSQIVPVQGHGLVIQDPAGDVEVKLASGEAYLDTNEVKVTFVNELPDDAEVTVNVIADFERVDSEGRPILRIPSVDIDLIAKNVYAYPMRAIYRATRESINQMQRELGVDMRGAVSAIVTSKYMLELNVRLLKQLKRRAKGFGRTKIADLSRGVTDTPVFNNTSEQARELLVTLSAAKIIINALLDVPPSGHDIYVTDNMSVLFDNLADDTHYRKIASAVGAPNQITRIGQIDGNVNVYHVPKNSGLLNETANAGEIMLVGRSGDPVRNPFVGFQTTPVTVRESTIVDFASGVTIEASQASELNPLERFADQCVVIEVTNLPVSISGV